MGKMDLCVNGGEDGESDEEGEEDIEALREALLEHGAVRDGVDHGALLLGRQCRVVQVLVVAKEALEKKYKLSFLLLLMVSADFFYFVVFLLL